MTAVTLDALDLAALLCSRVCHDVISPVGAIVNGLEVLEDEPDQSMRDFANELIRKSARQASARLQFARLAFGAAGSAGATIDLGDAEKVAQGFIHDDKVQLAWRAPRVLLPKNEVKLILNLLLIGVTTIPRGGTIEAEVGVAEERTRMRVASRGQNARVPAAVPGLLAGAPDSGVVDAHAIQPFYAGLIARAAGMNVTIAPEGEEIVIRAEPAAA